MMNDFINSYIGSIGHDFDSLGGIIALIVAVFILSLYEFVVYRLVSHRALYNKSFHITIMVLPFFIGGIVAALQSNLVITLGTIGALAIVRFRTAVKDPVDMIYILWSVFIGIMCGCGLYESCILISVSVTVVLILINAFNGSLLKNPYVLIVNAKDDIEDTLEQKIKAYSQTYRLKSRNYTSKGMDYVYQIETKKSRELTSELKCIDSIMRFSLLEFDNEDVI